MVQLDLSGHVKLDYDASTDAVINLINTSTSLKFVDIDGNGTVYRLNAYRSA